MSSAPRNDCLACAEAERNPASGRINAGCKSCAARDLARGPAFFEASLAGTLTPAYKSALLATFAKDWAAGHEQVKTWAEKLSHQTTGEHQ